MTTHDTTDHVSDEYLVSVFTDAFAHHIHRHVETTGSPGNISSHECHLAGIRAVRAALAQVPVVPDWVRRMTISQIDGYGIWWPELFAVARSNEDGECWEQVEDELPLAYLIGHAVSLIPGASNWASFDLYPEANGKWTACSIVDETLYGTGPTWHDALAAATAAAESRT